MDQNKVSVIIPTYNRPDLLLDAVESVIKQTYKNIELIVVDDNSDQNIQNIVENNMSGYSKSIEVLTHNKNMGQNQARNTGIKKSSGEYIALLDDDDVWKEEKIEKQVKKFKQCSDCVGAVYTWQRYVDSNDNPRGYNRSNARGDVTKYILSGGSICPTSSIMVKKTFIEKAGMLDPECPTWTDKEWYIRLSQYCEFEPVCEPLVIRRVYETDNMSQKLELKINQSLPYFIDKYEELALEHGYITKRKFLAELYALVGYTALTKKRYSVARKYSILCMYMYPFKLRNITLFILSFSGEIGYTFVRKTKRMING
ncbi:glycosyltransferase family 2 protein [Halorubrum ezzemoulense]|nr:glycosyltransferase family 2 protein [Halorubrum ezzemoulense]